MKDDGGGILLLLSVFGVGFLFGHIQVREQESNAMRWVLEATNKCEGSYEQLGFGDITGCVEAEILEIEEKRRELYLE